MTKVLSIISSIVHPFQKVCGNCHVANVIIFARGGVYYNACCSKSIVQKLNFFDSSIATNDKLVLLIIKGKWLETIVHMTKFEFLICFVQNKFDFSFQFTFMVNFDYCSHLPLLPFKKTSNNSSYKQKLV